MRRAKPMTVTELEPVEAAIDVRADVSVGDKPRIALLDGLPLANHALLRERLIIDDPDGRESKYEARQRNHGTSMASLITYGDLSDPGAPIGRPIYCYPILEPDKSGRRESAPRDELFIDVIHRAFIRMFEGRKPASPSVRVVNLSIGDPARTFIRRMSPLAKLIDYFAHRFNIVVVVSAGNQRPISWMTDVDPTDIKAVREKLPRLIADHTRNRGMYSPGESINSLTAGATHDDLSTPEDNDAVVDLFEKGVVAHYSPIGFGFRRSVKPELLLPGGRQFHVRPTSVEGGRIELRTAEPAPSSGPGILTAVAGLQGEADARSYSCGTSNAAALATRSVDALFELLERVAPDKDEFQFPDAQYHPVLAKALAVHATGWQDLKGQMRSSLAIEKNIRRMLTQLLGYGPLHDARVGTASQTRVVLVGAGSIKKDKRQSFSFPLPGALAAKKQWRRLTVTLAWLSPVNPRSQRYRQARLWFSSDGVDMHVDAVDADHNAVLKGTVQHQVFEGNAAVAFISGDTLDLHVDCRQDAGGLSGTVRYGIVASLEVAEDVEIDLHAQVRDLQRAQLRARQQAQERVQPR